MARTYAKVVGVVLLVVGVVGLFLSDDGFIGLNTDLVEDIIHLATGGLLAYVGFKGEDDMLKSVVMALGVIYLIVGVIGFILPDLFGLIPNEYGLFDNLLHLVLGVVAILAVRMGPQVGGGRATA